MKTAQYTIGTRFIRYDAKRQDVEEITDILTTTNSKGEIVGIEYVCEHKFMGQSIKNKALNSTIALSRIVTND